MEDNSSAIVFSFIVGTLALIMKDITFEDGIPVLIHTIGELSYCCRVYFVLVTTLCCDEDVFHTGIVILPAYKTMDPFTVVGALSAKFDCSHNNLCYKNL